MLLFPSRSLGRRLFAFPRSMIFLFSTDDVSAPTVDGFVFSFLWGIIGFVFSFLWGFFPLYCLFSVIPIEHSPAKESWSFRGVVRGETARFVALHSQFDVLCSTRAVSSLFPFFQVIYCSRRWFAVLGSFPSATFDFSLFFRLLRKRSPRIRLSTRRAAKKRRKTDFRKGWTKNTINVLRSVSFVSAARHGPRWGVPTQEEDPGRTWDRSR